MTSIFPSQDEAAATNDSASPVLTRVPFRQAAQPDAFLHVFVTTPDSTREGLVPVSQMTGLYVVYPAMTAIEFQNGGKFLVSKDLRETHALLRGKRDQDGVIDLRPYASADVLQNHTGLLAAAGDEVEDGIYLGKVNSMHWVVEKSHGKRASLSASFNEIALKRAVSAKDWQLPPVSVLRTMLETQKTGAFKGTYDDCCFYLSGDDDSQDSSRQFHVHSRSCQTSAYNKVDDTSVIRFVYALDRQPFRKPSV